MPRVKTEQSRDRWIGELTPEPAGGGNKRGVTRFRSARLPRQPWRPATKRPPKWCRKIPVIESALLEQNGKLDHLCHRTLLCEEKVEVVAAAAAGVKQTAVIPQTQHQLQDEFQKRIANLENTVHILQHRIHSDSYHQRQGSDLPEYHNPSSLPLSPPSTPLISPQQLRSTDENGDWSRLCSNAERRQSLPYEIFESSRQPNDMLGAESNEDTNHEHSSQAHDERWPIPVINLTERESATGSEPSSLLATPSKTPRRDAWLDTPSPTNAPGSPAEDDEPVSPSYDHRLRRHFVMQLRHALAQPAALLPSRAPDTHSASAGPPRGARPMSRAELRFKGAGRAKDLAFEVRRRLAASGCEELWAGGDAPARWDGATSVDERTRELAVGRLGWARDVAVDKE